MINSYYCCLTHHLEEDTGSSKRITRAKSSSPTNTRKLPASPPSSPTLLAPGTPQSAPSSPLPSLVEEFSSCSLDGPKGSPNASRKPYTVSKQRESWSPEEHRRFVEGVRLYKRDWKAIEKHVGTKSVIQIRSHAQKYFMKLQKSNPEVSIPPARPKRPSPKMLKKMQMQAQHVKQKEQQVIHSKVVLKVQEIPLPSNAPSPLHGSKPEKKEPVMKDLEVGSQFSDIPFPSVLTEIPPLMMQAQPANKQSPSPAHKPQDLGSPNSANKQHSNAPTPWPATVSSSPDNLPVNKENPVVANPNAFCQWMALNSYMFGIMCPTFASTQSAEIQRLHLEQLHKAQQYIQQQSAFDNWIGSPPSTTANPINLSDSNQPSTNNISAPPVPVSASTDLPTNEYFNSDDTKMSLPFETDRLNTGVLEQYYTLLGKQIDHLEKQVPSVSFSDCSTERASDSFKARMEQSNDIFSHLPDF